MNRSTARFLQSLTVLFGLAVLAFLLVEPHFEGRNARATVFEVYFQDPFLAYAYAGSVPFFWALGRAFGLFGDAGRHGKFSPATVEALRAIKRCAFTLIGFVTGALAIIVLTGDKEDRPQGVMMCLVVILGSGAVAFTAATLARKVQDSLRPASA
jgi:hypothetical protein